jgi:hypothetical protein
LIASSTSGSRLIRSLSFRKALPILALVCFASAADTAPGAATADPHRYLADIQTLTQARMEGRGDGTKGLGLAAGVLEHRYKSLGLSPAGTHGYLQPFSVITGAKLKSDNTLIVGNGDKATALELNRDFVPFSFSSSGAVNSNLVFAGYGATAPELGYDDYAGVDVKDKVVVVLRYEPAAFAQRSGNQGLTQHAQVITKAINARNHGAKALILVNGKLGDGEEDLLTRFGSVSGPENAGIVLLQVKNAVAEGWLQSAGKSLADLQLGIDHSAKPASVALSDALHLEAKVDIETTRATVNNVLAYLPGKTDEYVMLGAHYDHLGYGNYDSLAPSQIGQIHPGADDNASGTAGLLELARMLAPMKGQLQRGILFASFAGEELGLLGSAEWVKQPTLPLEKAVAMLNMDMIGRIKDGRVFVGGVGTGSGFPELLAHASANSGFKMEYSQGGYAASDHTSFIAQKIPVLFFFSGLHSDYHKPSDTWEKIDANDAAKLVDIIEAAAIQLANESDRPKFQVVAEEKPPNGSGGGGGYGPYFGSIPDFGQVETGVRFSDVKPGSPAAKAGLKGGDILIQFGDKPIKNLYDFSDALRRSKVDEVMQVTVLRDGKPVTVAVKLEQRK